MKILRKLRYYCDHCKKSGGQKAAMQKHESGCTLNPLRRCGLCAWREANQPSMSILITAASTGLSDLYEAASGCPACMLAGIRQCRKKYPADWDEGGYVPDGVHATCSEWRYKDAAIQFWKDYPERITEKQDAANRAAYEMFILARGANA